MATNGRLPIGVQEDPLIARLRALGNIAAGNTSVIAGPRGPQLRDVTGQQSGDLSGGTPRVSPIPPQMLRRIDRFGKRRAAKAAKAARNAPPSEPAKGPSPYDVPVTGEGLPPLEPSERQADSGRDEGTATKAFPIPMEELQSQLNKGRGRNKIGGPPAPGTYRQDEIDPSTGRLTPEAVWRRFHPDPLAGVIHGRPPGGVADVPSAGGTAGSKWFTDYAASLSPEERAAALDRVNAQLPAGIRQLEQKANLIRGERINTANRGNLQSYTHNAARPVISDAARLAFGISAPPVQYNMPNRGALVGGGPARIGEQIALADNLDRATNRQSLPVARDNARLALDALSGGTNRGNADFRAARATSLPATVSPMASLRGSAQNNMRDRMLAAPPEPSKPEPVRHLFDNKLLDAIVTSRENGRDPVKYTDPETGETRMVRASAPTAKLGGYDPAKAQAYQESWKQIQKDRHDRRIGLTNEIAEANKAGMTLPAYRFMNKAQEGEQGGAPMTIASALRKSEQAYAMGDEALGDAYARHAAIMGQAEGAAADNRRKDREMDLTEASLRSQARQRIAESKPWLSPEEVDSEVSRELGGGAQQATPAQTQTADQMPIGNAAATLDKLHQHPTLATLGITPDTTANNLADLLADRFRANSPLDHNTLSLLRQYALARQRLDPNFKAGGFWHRITSHSNLGDLMYQALLKGSDDLPLSLRVAANRATPYLPEGMMGGQL